MDFKSDKSSRVPKVYIILDLGMELGPNVLVNVSKYKYELHEFMSTKQNAVKVPLFRFTIPYILYIYI